MRHIQQRRPRRLQFRQHVEQVIRLRVGQRRGWLVEHEDPALEGEGAGHLQQLAMGGRQLFGEGVWIDLQVEARQDLASALAHLRLAQAAEPAQLASREDVGGDAEVGEAQHFLVDHADAALDRIARARHTQPLALPPHLTGIGAHEAGQDLQQRGLAGAVLTDQRMGFAGFDLEAHAVEGLDGAKRFVDVVEGEAHGRPHLISGNQAPRVRLSIAPSSRTVVSTDGRSGRFAAARRLQHFSTVPTR